jgi:hypothetical protein
VTPEDERRARQREYQRQWRAANPDKERAKKERYRASEKGQTTEKAWRRRSKHVINRAGRAYRARHPDRAWAQTLAWRKNNPEKMRDIKQRHYEKNADKIASKNLQSLYGVDAAQFVEMLRAQGHRCAICGDEFGKGCRPNVDHCHASNRVRGLLCSRCNGGIGMLRDDCALLAAAIEYLKQHGAT